MNNKRGLSPVIATTLLILIAVVLAVIIFIWVKSFIGEKVTKDLGGGSQPIDTFCAQVGFDGEVTSVNVGSSAEITIVNNKDVPIYGIEVHKKGLASTAVVCLATSTSVGVTSGEDQKMDSSSCSNLKSGDSLVLVPVLVGQSGETKKAYTCAESYGLGVKVT